MDDTRETLRRGIGDFAPGPDGYERVLRRLGRKRRQRIAAAAVAIAIVLTGTALFARAFTRDQVPLHGGSTLVLPSDSQIVYSATVGPSARGYYSGDIYLIAPGREPRRILEPHGINRVCPAFSPDGTELAYIQDPRAMLDTGPSSGTLMVVGVGPDGAQVGTPSIVKEGLDETSTCPAWSPDGHRIAMVRGGDEVMVATLGTGSSVTAEHSFHLAGPVTFPDGPDVPAMAWSPDGSTIVAIHGGSLWLIHPDGSSDPSILHHMNGTMEAVGLAWSPDGSRLAVGDSTGELGTRGTVSPATLQIVDARTGSSTPVPLDGLPKGWDTGLYGVTWLPGQDRIAVTFQRAFVVVDPDGGLTPMRLREPPITNVVWSPDEQWFVYTTEDTAEGGYALVAQPIDGSPPVVLTPWGGDVEWATGYDWKPAPG
jgi:dipeptidyl aminopeptidase/acylaminoacyl peptidase